MIIAGCQVSAALALAAWSFQFACRGDAHARQSLQGRVRRAVRRFWRTLWACVVCMLAMQLAVALTYAYPATTLCANAGHITDVLLVSTAGLMRGRRTGIAPFLYQLPTLLVIYSLLLFYASQ